jgi:hypothetical protein
MIRNIDLIRKILFQLETLQTYGGYLDLTLEGVKQEEINYHLYLLHDAGLIQAITGQSAWGLPVIHPLSLSWKGCEFLDAARDDTRWNNAKKVVGKISANVFEIIFKVLVESAMAQILPS